jgi:hypothetical protein
MTLFPIILIVLFLIVFWQLVSYIHIPQGHPARKNILVRLVLLLLVVGITSYAWSSAIRKETAFMNLLLPYPESTIDLFQTPIFSDSPYWTYVAQATPDQVFNWYRSRAKHAGWVVAEEGDPNARVFVIVVPVRISIFVIVKQEDNKTVITYTTEGEMMRQTVSS